MQGLRVRLHLVTFILSFFHLSTHNILLSSCGDPGTGVTTLNKKDQNPLLMRPGPELAVSSNPWSAPPCTRATSKIPMEEGQRGRTLAYSGRKCVLSWAGSQHRDRTRSIHSNKTVQVPPVAQPLQAPERQRPCDHRLSGRNGHGLCGRYHPY